jgi:hypothetical protein
MNEVGNYHIHFCLKCFNNKNVVVPSSDIEIYSVVQVTLKQQKGFAIKKITPIATIVTMITIIITITVIPQLP